MTKTILEEYSQAYSEQLICNSELIIANSELVQKMHILEKKLEIATKALEKIERIKNNFPILLAHSYSREALKEMEGVK